MDAKFNLNDNLRLWGIGDVANAAKMLAGAGLGNEQTLADALQRGDLGGEVLAKARELAPMIAQQYPQLAQAIGYPVRK
ncbi:MAG: hypothetical protein IKZ07_05530 [Akkermansia sp.]|nr:hypothetical protein [Akkermansia sp.]